MHTAEDTGSIPNWSDSPLIHLQNQAQCRQANPAILVLDNRKMVKRRDRLFRIRRFDQAATLNGSGPPILDPNSNRICNDFVTNVLQINKSVNNDNSWAVIPTWWQYIITLNVQCYKVPDASWDSVNNLGKVAFAFCGNLTRVNFQGNAPQDWSRFILSCQKCDHLLFAGITGWGETFGGRPTKLWKE